MNGFVGVWSGINSVSCSLISIRAIEIRAIQVEVVKLFEEAVKKDSITMKELLELISSQQQEFIIHVEPEEETADEA